MKKLKTKNPLNYCKECNFELDELLERGISLIRKCDSAICMACEEKKTGKRIEASLLEGMRLSVDTEGEFNHLDEEFHNLDEECIQEDRKEHAPKNIPEILKTEENNPNCFSEARRIYNLLDEQIVGQTKTKKALAMAFNDHMKRLRNPSLPKKNVLIAGPSGTGKTRMCEILAEEAGVPFLSYDANTLTASGFQGDSTDSIFMQLLLANKRDVRECERAIIFLDEIDKKAKRGGQPGEINTEAAQAALLKVLEKGTVSLKVNNKTYTIKTDKMLFICAGAFTGMSTAIKQAPKNKVGIIKQETTPKTVSTPLSKRLIDYGMTNEFVGRFSILTETQKLSPEQMKSVFTEKKNHKLKGQIASFESNGVKLAIKDCFFEKMASLACLEETGVRAAHNLLDAILTSIPFEFSPETKNVTLTAKGWRMNNERKTRSYDEQ